MYSILIASRNIDFTKELLMRLSNDMEEVKINYITTTECETINAIISGTVDIVAFDDLRRELSIDNVFLKLNNLYISAFPKVILISSNIRTLYNNRKILFLHEEIKIEKIVDDIKSIIFSLEEKKNRKFYESKILYEFCNIGFKLSHKGTKYLVEAIILVKLCKNEDFSTNLERNIYSIIATRHHTNVGNVKSNIQKAIYYIYRYNDREEISKYFCIKDNSNVSSKAIISIMCNKI